MFKQKTKYQSSSKKHEKKKTPKNAAHNFEEIEKQELSYLSALSEYHLRLNYKSISQFS